MGGGRGVCQREREREAEDISRKDGSGWLHCGDGGWVTEEGGRG
jgi:hypothetical protein